MLPSSANSGPIPDVFKAKMTALIQEQLKPIVTELATQHQTLLNQLALLKHNHNVNDYQMTRLENIRDLEQSINFKVAGVLDFDPFQHPTIGTNLREPVPADPQLIPKFTPVDQATPAERAARSAALIKEAGTSARQIGVPLTFQDFPDHPSMNSSGKKEDPMHASIPLFGLRAPRWRAKQGLDAHTVPGTVAYDGAEAPPAGTAGLRLYNNRARELRVPMSTLRRTSTIRYIATSTPCDTKTATPTSSTMSSTAAEQPKRIIATPNSTIRSTTSTVCHMKTAAPTSSTSSSAAAAAGQPKHTIATPKRGRRTTELEDTADDMIADGNSNNNQEGQEEEAEPARKRRKRAAVSQPRPAPRGRATKGKKAKK